MLAHNIYCVSMTGCLCVSVCVCKPIHVANADALLFLHVFPFLFRRGTRHTESILHVSTFSPNYTTIFTTSTLAFCLSGIADIVVHLRPLPSLLFISIAVCAPYVVSNSNFWRQWQRNISSFSIFVFVFCSVCFVVKFLTNERSAEKDQQKVNEKFRMNNSIGPQQLTIS